MEKVKEQRPITQIELERRRRGWTQTELAYFSHLSQADVSKIESGHPRPYTGQAVRIARALGLDPDRMLEEAATGVSRKK